ncbi:DUF349 domain-containing protein [Bacteroides caecigallinarum]|uniref:DUF349 domain-containing protein n=1 Tax=Bacteroides caecigallinarum TaxID=1411144 RepID=UPI001F392BF5|nr:DUF349 domain-containing protein [Bacteroides caecigallinarum]MCF2594649.1 DUF349 domain-containing protein [Bacteroides caecigallinarum]
MEVNETNRPLTEEQANVSETLVPTVEQTTENVKYEPKHTKEEVIQRLKEINEKACESDKQEIDFLKQTFYKLHKIEQEANRKAYIESGGEADAFVPSADPLEADLKSVLAEIKEKRNSMTAALEKEKEENLQKKLEILEKMKGLTDLSEDAGKNYNEFKALQQEWNEIKLIPANKVNEIWKTYQLYTEKFYDMLKLNNEFREYDFKKNLELKTRICEAAEKLADEPDVISAFHQLQKLHQEFREIGPVAKEVRESIWNRFKSASTVVNKRHQKHFEDLKEQEQNNLDQKTVICEIAEAMEYDKFTTFTDWEDKTQEILALQAKWKTIGYAPQKMNLKIFERFRAACDEFFRRKAEFFKTAKENMALNLEKKKELCEKAEALKDSTAWKETAEILTKLQKEWKTIGPVPKKYSDAVWKRFIGACDYFFEQKQKATSSQRSEELENMAKKQAIIKRVEELAETNDDENIGDKVKSLISEWNSVGFVPFKEKDRLYKEFHSLVNRIFDKANLSAAERKLNTYKSGLNKEANLYKEREKLVRIYERIKTEIKTYENNLGFLSSTSKKGNSLLNDISRKIDKLKADLDLTQKKIDAIDETLNL